LGLKEKKILVGVTGGIAAYKAAELVSSLRRNGASVRVIMTQAATKFVTPITFQTLSGFPVRSELFVDWSQDFIPHIANADWADVVAIVPATANIIGKIAHGIADDLLTTTVMAAEVPVILAPAMNEKMYKNPVFQRNIKLLQSMGYHFVEPEVGRLACEQIGKGRLASIDKIIEHIEMLTSKKDYQDLRVLITAGGTREPLDPVRYISNRSSGKTGYALASAARRRGAEVTLISAPTCLPPPLGVELIKVETAREMLEACRKKFNEVDIVIKAAAVSDFEPAQREVHKIKKEEGLPSIPLKKTPDILKELGGLKDKQFIVGFCAESEDLVSNARRKLMDKNLDMVVANDITRGIFESDYTSIVILDSTDKIQEHDNISKEEAANIILDAIMERYRS